MPTDVLGLRPGAILLRKVWRIGVLTLFERDGNYFISCENRTYRHTHQFQPEQLTRWRQLVETGR